MNNSNRENKGEVIHNVVHENCAMIRIESLSHICSAHFSLKLRLRLFRIIFALIMNTNIDILILLILDPDLDSKLENSGKNKYLLINKTFTKRLYYYKHI